jgi:hypothetical protein
MIMLFVACQQVWRVQTSILNSNRGGGFGMFSTIDSSHLRFLRVDAFDADGHSVGSCGSSVVPARARALLEEVKWLPDQARLDRLGRAILGTDGGLVLSRVTGPVELDGKKPPRSFDQECEFAAAPARVELRLGSVDFDAARNRVRSYLVAQRTVERSHAR